MSNEVTRMSDPEMEGAFLCIVERCAALYQEAYAREQAEGSWPPRPNDVAEQHAWNALYSERDRRQHAAWSEVLRVHSILVGLGRDPSVMGWVAYDRLIALLDEIRETHGFKPY